MWHRYIIVGFIRTSGKVSIYIILWRCLPNIISPVKSGITFLRTSHPLIIILSWEFTFSISSAGPSLSSCICIYIRFSISGLNPSWVFLPAIISIDRNCIFTLLLSFLSSYHYYTISSTNTINSSRSIFQYWNVFNIIKVHIIKLPFIRLHTINHKQRGTHITNLQCSRSTRTTILHTSIQTCDLTNQCSWSSRCSWTLDIRWFNRRNGTCQSSFLLWHTETGNNDFIEYFCVFF